MKLYMYKLSPNVRRVRLTAAVLGIELEEQEIDLRKGEQKSPEYLALNPNGAVPPLVDGDFVLTESRAIMQYFTMKKPEAGLLPRDETARADVVRWQFWDASHFSPKVASVVFEKLIKPMFGMGEPDAKKVADGLAAFRRFGAVLDKRLDGRTYVVGDALTLADLALAATLAFAKQAELPLAELPHVDAWLSRITALDAWKKASL
jgi:glutathione S-transferase